MVTAVNVDLIHHVWSTGMLWWKKTYTDFYYFNNGKWYKIGKTMDGQIKEDMGPQLSALVNNGQVEEVKDPYRIKSLSRLLHLMSN